MRLKWLYKKIIEQNKDKTPEEIAAAIEKELEQRVCVNCDILAICHIAKMINRQEFSCPGFMFDAERFPEEAEEEWRGAWDDRTQEEKDQLTRKAAESKRHILEKIEAEKFLRNCLSIMRGENNAADNSDGKQV